MKTRWILPVALLCLVNVVALAVEKRAARPEGSAKPFDTVAARFEQNATDGDVEAVFEAIGGDDGLAKLTITAPNGHMIVDFKTPGATGMRQFRFESPEPKDAAALKKAFPEGEYVFAGSSPSGARFRGKATLSHKLPDNTSFIVPKAEARGLPATGLKISWAPVKGVAGYTIELDPAKTSAHLEMKLPPSVTSFVVPKGILAPGSKCQLGIGTVSKDGNVSVIETSFTTAN
jgi:hypothetical protein